jgi:hypothetical protein
MNEEGIKTPRVMVASVKPYWMPSDPFYLPVQVNAARAQSRFDGFQQDDEGDNISLKNAHYSELTALWWGWRNLECEALGLVHHRRHFAGTGERGILTLDEATSLLDKVPIVVPKARNYIIETAASHYAHTHDSAHLDALRTGVKAVSPDRIDAYNDTMTSKSIHMFNMLLMRREALDSYCQWLFDVLSVTESHIDFSGMTPYEKRCIGRLGEFLLDVWLRSENIPYQEVGLRELERTSWIKKGMSFLAAKFLGKRYHKSF